MLKHWTLQSVLQPRQLGSCYLTWLCQLLLLLTAFIMLIGCRTNNDSTSTTQQQTPPPRHLAVWSNTLNGVPITMVGTDPSVPGAGTTSVAVQIIPVALNFSAVGIVISPEGPACGDSDTILHRVVNSPLFTSNDWTDVSGTISVGKTQFADAYQRMNFWHYVSGVSPNYHVMLTPVTARPAIMVDVPPGIGAILTPSPTCPSQMLGTLPDGFLNSAIQSAIASSNTTPDMLPIFLTYDINFTPSGFLGYHNMAGDQAYIVASYIDVGYSDPRVIASDVAVLSHEIGEWMDDPLLNNVVAPWGNLGIEAGCNQVLEVGDPLSRNIYTLPTPGFDYHVQELAFASWFAGPYPSVAIDGLYSSLGTFSTPAPPCQ